MTEDNRFFTEDQNNSQNEAPRQEETPSEQRTDGNGQNPFGSSPFGSWQTPSAGGSFQNGGNAFYGAPIPPKKPKKPGLLGWIVALGILYFLLVGGLFALIAGGALTFGVKEESSEVIHQTEEEAKESATEEKEQNAPIVENPSEDGNNLIVGEDYTGEALTASELYEKNVDCVVFVTANFRQGTSRGSGFVIDSENGYILTNHHVVTGSEDIAVTFKNGDSYTAKLIGGDEINDVAVLQIEAANLKHVTISDSDKIRVGEDVLIIGNPLSDLTFTLTKGIVSATNRTINTGEYNIKTFQTDAAINSGNSGGPAFDATGAVVGIASAKYASTGVEGIGFCIPINDAMAIAKDLVQHGYVTGRPNFGIAVSDSMGYEYTTDEFGRRVLVETTPGARVEEIGKKSCAAEAGIQVGDIITKLGDVKIQTATQLINAKNAYKAGDTVTVEVYRKGETLTFNITLDEYTPD